ncbi:MAG TPA: EAL domain-containing protein [Rickettsiales bacterium]|nr:EAL domain-containing protein [Rickettsiales bacterium]
MALPSLQQPTPLQILLIEDNEGDAFLVQETLEDTRAGFAVSHAYSIAEAEPMYRAQDFDILLLDLSLPGISGLDAVEKLQHDLPRTPIIVMTGLNDETKALYAMQAGAQDYLVKGRYSNEALPRAIRYAIERKRFENEVIELAHFDRVTRLMHSDIFRSNLEAAIIMAAQNGMHLAVLLVSLRRFRDVTTMLGHEAGNALLKEVAVRLKECLMAQDCAARLEGDEFVLLLTGSRARDEELPGIAQRIMEHIQMPFFLEGAQAEIGCSIGIATYPACGRSAGELMKHADIALHRARQATKDEFQFFTDKLNVEFVERMTLEKELREALKSRLLVPYYQPIMDLKNNTVCGVETLLHWQHPEKGLIPPGAFMPIAQKSDLVVDISAYVTELACNDYRLWKKNLPQTFYVTINLSGKDIQSQSFTDRLAKILGDSGMNPKNIALEITECALTDDAKQSIEALRKCREMGASIFVDDFGTGYSSLSYLSVLPLDILKIHRSFVSGIETNEHNRLIATSTIHLAKGLGLKVIAEGIETGAQKDLLTELGCDKAQGSFFAKPMTAGELMKWLPKTA